MSFARKFALASVVFATAFGVAGQAHAVRLFKGVAIITARTNTPACVLQYDVLESFVVIYDANLGAEPTPERFSIMSNNGSLLLTSTDATKTLRGGGTISIAGNILARPVAVPTTNAVFGISAVVQNTSTVTMSATIHNAGLPGCSVTIRGALTLMPPGAF
jgi:hypothetical protein